MRPIITTDTKIIAVDGGYAAMGITALAVRPDFKLDVLFTQAIKRNNRGHDNATMREQIRWMADRVALVGDSFGWRNVLFAWEDWRGGKHPTTTRWRGAFDERAHTPIESNDAPLVLVEPMIHKAILNPTGVATDGGRKDELEYLNRLNHLDFIISPTDLREQVAKPTFAGDVKRAWKDGRQHTLDACAVGVAVYLAALYDGIRCRGVEVPATQLPTIERVATKAGFI